MEIRKNFCQSNHKEVRVVGEWIGNKWEWVLTWRRSWFE